MQTAAAAAAKQQQQQPQPGRRQAGRRRSDESSSEQEEDSRSSSSSSEEDSEGEDSDGEAAGRPASRRVAAAAAAAGDSEWDSDGDWEPEGAGAAAADGSDSDYVPDEAELLPEERREQRWMEQQRRERSLAFTPAGNLGGGGSFGAGGRRGRRGSLSSVKAKVKAEPLTAAKPAQRQRQPKRQQQQQGGGGGVETISLLSSDSEDEGPAVRPGSGAPRTAASHPPPTLRLSFRAAAGTARQRLAVVRVRTCTPLKQVMEALAACCLEGGCAADAAGLALSLGAARLDPEHTVRQAGLQDGDLIEVSLMQ